MRGRDIRRVQADLAARRAASKDEAAARAHRGRALVQAAIEGRPLPEPPPAAAPRPPVPAAGDELVSCRRCYGPHTGLPGSLCPRCQPATQSLDDLNAAPYLSGETTCPN